MRKWDVRFLGDPDYGRDAFEAANAGTEVEAVDASTAARKGLAEWRSTEDPRILAEENWYGEGTIVAVREIVDPPPIKVFVKAKGRLKMERAS